VEHATWRTRLITEELAPTKEPVRQSRARGPAPARLMGNCTSLGSGLQMQPERPFGNMLGAPATDGRALVPDGAATGPGG
jgi:hypothetical protein